MSDDLSTREILEQALAILSPPAVGADNRWVQEDWYVLGRDNTVDAPVALEKTVACSVGAMRLVTHLEMLENVDEDLSEIEVRHQMMDDPSFRRAIYLLHEVIKERCPKWHREAMSHLFEYVSEDLSDYFYNYDEDVLVLNTVTLYNDDGSTEFKDIEQLFQHAIKKAVAYEETV